MQTIYLNLPIKNEDIKPGFKYVVNIPQEYLDDVETANLIWKTYLSLKNKKNIVLYDFVIGPYRWLNLLNHTDKKEMLIYDNDSDNTLMIFEQCFEKLSINYINKQLIFYIKKYGKKHSFTEIQNNSYKNAFAERKFDKFTYLGKNNDEIILLTPDHKKITAKISNIEDVQEMKENVITDAVIGVRGYGDLTTDAKCKIAVKITYKQIMHNGKSNKCLMIFTKDFKLVNYKKNSSFKAVNIEFVEQWVKTTLENYSLQ